LVPKISLSATMPPVRSNSASGAGELVGLISALGPGRLLLMERRHNLFGEQAQRAQNLILLQVVG
jgi:hypothetical protein